MVGVVTSTALDPIAAPVAPRRVSPATRRFWLVAGSILTVATLLFGTYNIVNSLSHEVTFADYSFSADAVRALRVDVDRGSIRIVASEDTRVHVHARISRGLHDTSHDVALRGHTLVADATCPHFQDFFCSVEYTIRVPASVSTSVSSANSSINIRGLTGPIRIDSVDGDVTGRELGSRTASASTVDGDVTLTFDTDPTIVDASSVDGDVVVRLPRGRAYHVDASTVDGSTSTEIRTDPASNRSIIAGTVDGDITIAYRTAS
jgi:hypothetical protein